MSQGKFAPMTASLLVRRGEAAPSVIAQPERQATQQFQGRRQAPDQDTNHKFAFAPEAADGSAPPSNNGKDNGKLRRIVLTMTAQEYETLGLVAVKTNSTRHALAQSAMDAYFEWLVAEYGEACSCIVGGALCRCECSE